MASPTRSVALAVCAGLMGVLASCVSAAETVVTIKDGTPAMDEYWAPTQLAKGVMLTVEKEKGEWLAVKGTVRGKPFSGFVKKADVEKGVQEEPRPADFTNSLGMRFVGVPSGEFRMGTTEEEFRALNPLYQPRSVPILLAERPDDRVRITKAFLIGKYEVTVGQFRKFAEATGFKTEPGTCAGWYTAGGYTAKTLPGGRKVVEKSTRMADASWEKPYLKQTDTHPVTCVSWLDAKKVIEWLNANDSARPAGWAYRLPTEAEWEYAARGPNGLLYPWGHGMGPGRCNFAGKGTGFAWDDKTIADEFTGTSPVGFFSPKGDSPFGACDMAGNVEEWCEDWAGGRYPEDPVEDPTGPPKASTRVARGGSWLDPSHYVRTAARTAHQPFERYSFLGFRLVLAPARPEPPSP